MAPLYLKDVLLVRRHPLVEDGTAPLEGDSTRRLQHERQRLRRLEEMDDDIQRVDRPLIKELKEAGRSGSAGAVVAPIAIVTPTGEGDGIDAVGVVLLGEEEKRVLPGPGEDARHEERQPAGLLRGAPEYSEFGPEYSGDAPKSLTALWTGARKGGANMNKSTGAVHTTGSATRIAADVGECIAAGYRAYVVNRPGNHVETMNATGGADRRARCGRALSEADQGEKYQQAKNSQYAFHAEAPFFESMESMESMADATIAPVRRRQERESTRLQGAEEFDRCTLVFLSANPPKNSTVACSQPTTDGL